MIVCMIENMTNKQKEWHTATKPYNIQHIGFSSYVVEGFSLEFLSETFKDLLKRTDF